MTMAPTARCTAHSTAKCSISAWSLQRHGGALGHLVVHARLGDAGRVDGAVQAPQDGDDLAGELLVARPLPKVGPDHMSRLDLPARRLTTFGEDPALGAGKAAVDRGDVAGRYGDCLLYTSPSPRDGLLSRMPSSA